MVYLLLPQKMEVLLIYNRYTYSLVIEMIEGYIHIVHAIVQNFQNSSAISAGA